MKYKCLDLAEMNRRIGHPKDEDERTALSDIIDTIEECERENYNLIDALRWNRARRVEMIENKEGYEETPGICRAVISEIDKILPMIEQEHAAIAGTKKHFRRYRS